MRTDDYLRIMQQDRLFVMPVKADARHAFLDNFSTKGIILAIGYMPDQWKEKSSPHYIPHSCCMANASLGIIEKSSVAAFCMLHNMCNLLTMSGHDVYFPSSDIQPNKPLTIVSKLYNPNVPPDQFRIISKAFGIKDHIGQKIMEEAAPGFTDYLEEKDQKEYNRLRSHIRGVS